MANSLAVTDEALKIEKQLLEATQLLEAIFAPYREVEQDAWVQLPPIWESTVKLKLEYLGRAKPDPLPDELQFPLLELEEPSTPHLQSKSWQARLLELER